MRQLIAIIKGDRIRRPPTAKSLEDLRRLVRMSKNRKSQIIYIDGAETFNLRILPPCSINEVVWEETHFK